MNKEYVNEALRVCHKAAESLLRSGIISADEMKEFDNGCLEHKPEVSPEVEKFIKMENGETKERN
jgi:DNA-binding transcriptional regulator YiaG